MRQTKKQKQHLYWFIIACALYAGAMTLWIATLDEAQPVSTQTTVSEQTKSEQVKAPFVPKNSYHAKTTWFGAECHTKWCEANKDKPRGRKVALNAKYGHATKVVIPAFGDEPYEVIGTTDHLTDVDVWCLSDEVCQKQVNSQTQLINLIYD
jgi:hypothetical protein